MAEDSVTAIAAEPAAGDWPLRPWLLAGLLGLAGLLIHLFTHEKDDVPWRAAAAAFLLFGSLGAAFTLERGRWKEPAAFAVVIGLVMAGLAWRAVNYGDHLPDEQYGFASGVVATALALPLFQAGFVRRRFATPYAEIYQHIWTDAICAAGALAFTGLSWVALAFLSELFRLLRIDFLHDLMNEGWFGWNFDFGHEIQLGTFSGSPSSPTAKVAILFPDGTGFGFVLQSNGQWIPDPGIGTADAPNDLKLEFVGTLPSNLADVKSSSSTWKLTDGDDTVWTLQTRVGPNGGSYDRGWVNQMVTRDGYIWNFSYNSDSSLASITDSFGRTATFTWYQYFITTLASPPAGTLPYPLAIRSIALPDGTSLQYTYDPPPATSAPSSTNIKRLVKVERLSSTNAVLNSASYLYEDVRFPTHVTGIIDNRGIRTRTYAYDSQGRAVSTAVGNDVDTVDFGQNGTALTRQVTNALGKTETYTYSNFTTSSTDYRLTQVDGAASANTPSSTSALGYGSDTFISSQTDEEGRVTTTTRDARGRPTTIVEGVGTPSERTTTITWDPAFNVPDSIVRPGLTETRGYNATGQLTSVTLTDTTSQSTPYPTNGQTRTTAYDWDANGRLLSVNGPLAPDGQGHDDVTSYTYDTQGNLLTSTDAMGHVTTFGSYDANGRPGTMTDPNGIVTAYTYDPLGRVQTITVQHPTDSALNATTTISYDAVGEVTGLTLPSTDTLIMDYDDEGRVTSVRAASGERRDYTYDAIGNVTGQTVRRADGSTSRQITSAFDELGRTLSQTTGTGHTQRLSYDKVGNVVSSTSPNGNASTQAFDALDRLVTTVAPDNGSTSRSYDALDNLTSHTDPISVTTQFVYDGFGDVIQEVSPDRGTSTYWYDAAGRLIQSSDGRGQVIAYTRDYLGRVTSKVPQGRPASEAVTFYWDAGGLSGSYDVGHLAKVVDGSGTTQFQYDHRGNLLARQQTIGTGAAQLAYAYDLADRITQITYPSGRLVKYDYDSEGRVSSVETKATASVGTWTTLSNAYAYEPFGSVKAMTLGNGLAVAYDWGNDGRLASRRLYRTVDGTNLSYLTYRYDADDNIAAIDDQLSSTGSAAYGYDGNDRLTFAVMDGATVGSQSFAYTSGTNRLASTTDATGTRAIAYDARGNTASETRPGSIAAATDYDGYGRLISYSRTDTGTQTFTYNGLDDRVSMALPSGTHNFVYDADGRVIGEYGASSADVKAEFIWALPQAANDNAYGGDDGLGGYAPLAVATPDSGGAVQLNWVYGNHLGVPLVTTDATGVLATTPNDYLAPGFPGQSRVIADVFYNRYRDYDPTVGRYIQADPIGLGGGSNPYLYAKANPINATDPSGRNPLAAAAATGCLADIETGCAPGALVGLGLAGVYGLFVLSHPPKLRPRPVPAVRPSCPDNNDNDCEQEWAAARQFCRDELAKPFPSRALTGGHRDVESCARGHVSERCGGNPIDHHHDPYAPGPRQKGKWWSYLQIEWKPKLWTTLNGRDDPSSTSRDRIPHMPSSWRMNL